MKRELSRMKNTQVSNIMNIRPMEAELLHADRRTDMTKLTVNFRNITNAPKHCSFQLKRSPWKIPRCALCDSAAWIRGFSSGTGKNVIQLKPATINLNSDPWFIVPQVI
jgi:hypothetical protein